MKIVCVECERTNFTQNYPAHIIPTNGSYLTYITLYVFIFPICLCQRSRLLFSYMDRPGTCIILDKKYNIANSSCHFGSYGSIWTGPSPKKYYMDLRSFGPYKNVLVTDRSLYCHMTLSAMNYLLYSMSYTFQQYVKLFFKN